MTGFAPPRDISRRSFLIAGAGAAATAALPDVALAARKKAGKLDPMRRSTWEPLVGTIVEVRNDGRTPVPLEVLEVKDLIAPPKQSDAFKERSFAVVFRGSLGEPLAADTHRIRVPRSGKVRIWFSAARLQDDGWYYTAIFANAKMKGRPPKKPRVRGSEEQARKRGIRRRRRREREESKAKRAPQRRERRPELAKPSPTGPTEPAQPAPAPEPGFAQAD